MELKSSLLRKGLAVAFVLAAVSALPSNAATVPDLYTVTVVPDPAAARSTCGSDTSRDGAVAGARDG